MPWEMRRKDIKSWVKRYNKSMDLILRSIAVVVMSVSLAKLLPITSTTHQHLHEYAILKEMVEVDDLMHKTKDMIQEMLGSWYSRERDQAFKIRDYKYHTAIYQDDKLKAAMELFTMISDESVLLQQLGRIDIVFMEKIGELTEDLETLQSLISQ